MPDPKCLENIHRMPPPYNRLCTPEFCLKNRFFINRFCADIGRPPDTPVACVDPNLPEPGYCYCCCDSSLASLPLRMADGGYAFGADLRPGDRIMAAGPELAWRPISLVDVHIAPGDLPQPDVVELAYRIDNDERRVVVGADTLLLDTDRTLVAAGELVAGSRLAGAAGGEVTIEAVRPGSWAGGHATIRLGADADGKLADRLLDVAGLVVADYAVQLHRAAGSGQRAEAAGIKPSRGVAASGFRPAAVGARAAAASYAFFTPDQQDDVENNGTFRSKSITSILETARYLQAICRAFYPRFEYRVDWENDEPNGYVSTESGVSVITLNGGLVRADVLNRDGFALILCELIAAAEGNLCKGDAAYVGTLDVGRLVWQAGFYLQLVVPGIGEVRKLFDWVDTGHAGPDPGDHCAEPGLDCRLACYQAGVAFEPLPDCAKPAAPLVAKRAIAAGREWVAILFDAPVDPATGGDPANYALKPNVAIESADVDPVDPTRVNLGTASLTSDQTYTLTIRAVRSTGGGLISPNPTHLKFTAS